VGAKVKRGGKSNALKWGFKRNKEGKRGIRRDNSDGGVLIGRTKKKRMYVGGLRRTQRLRLNYITPSRTDPQLTSVAFQCPALRRKKKKKLVPCSEASEGRKS